MILDYAVVQLTESQYVYLTFNIDEAGNRSVEIASRDKKIVKMAKESWFYTSACMPFLDKLGIFRDDDKLPYNVGIISSWLRGEDVYDSKKTKVLQEVVDNVYFLNHRD